MLESDPTDTTDTSTAGDAPHTAPPPRKRARKAAAAQPATDAAGEVPAAKAAKKAAAKAPAATAAKRARKTTAAPQALLDLETVLPEVVAPPPVKKAARKRAAKKSAASTASTTSTTSTADTTDTADTADTTNTTDTAVTAGPVTVGAEVAEERATAGRGGVRGGVRAGVRGGAEPDAADGAPDGAPDVASAAMAAPGVLFLPPVEQPAPKRRRAAKKAAQPAAAAAPSAASSSGPGAAPTDSAGPDGAGPGGTDRDSADPAGAGSAGTDPDSVDPDSVDPDGVDPDALDPDIDPEIEVADPDDVREAAIEQASGARRRRRRGRRGRGGARAADADTSDDSDPDADTDGAAEDDAPATAPPTADADAEAEADDGAEEGTGAGSRRRRRRRRSGTAEDSGTDDPPNTVTHVRTAKADGDDGVRGVRGSTRLEAKRQRRRDGRETTRRRAPILTEAEFLARREAVDRVMAVRQNGDRTQIAVLEDGVLVEHYVTRASATSYVGNVYLGRVQNVLPSMEAAFIDIGKGRNGVLYAGEVNWDAAGLEGKSRAIEQALKSGDSVLVQVTKDPIGHKGARLTSQVSLPGRFLVYVPGGGMTGISRRLPDTERHRLKAILKKIVPEDAGVIVRTAAEGASEEDLTHDVQRLQTQWGAIQKQATKTKSAPLLVHGEPDLAIRVVRDVFNEDFKSLVVEGDDAWKTISDYVDGVAPDLAERTSRHTADTDLFHDLRVDEQLMKALDRKVWLPSGGSLVIDRTEAMTVIDVNTGKFVGSGGNLEQTVTRNNLEAAEEVVRQLRLRDVGGIVVIDFIDMVLESNRDLVLRRLTECLGRDRTKHQVAEVTSLGLVQMTRKRVGEGLLEAFSEPCEVCHGRGVILHGEPVDQPGGAESGDGEPKRRRRAVRNAKEAPAEPEPPASSEQRQAAAAAIAAIHRAAAAGEDGEDGGNGAALVDELVTGLVEAAARVASDEAAASATDEPATSATDEPAASATDEPAADPRSAGAPAGEQTPSTATAMAAVVASEAPSADRASAAVPPAPPQTTDATDAADDHEAPSVDRANAGGSGDISGNGTPGRRRRRSASRPAGPPVPTG